jgi:myosin-1
MDVVFDFKGDPIGGKLISYLLEKSRVVKQQPGERNFHAFYSLVNGTTESELNEYYLKAKHAEKFNYLTQGGSTSALSNQAEDKQNYLAVNEAMKVSNFEPELIKTIWG